MGIRRGFILKKTLPEAIHFSSLFSFSFSFPPSPYFIPADDEFETRNEKGKVLKMKFFVKG